MHISTVIFISLFCIAFSPNLLTYMNLQIILSLGLLLALSVDFVTSVPIAAPAFEWQAQTVQSAAVEFDPNQRAEVEDFIESNGITGQDIEEYQRMSKLTRFFKFHQFTI